MGAMFVSTSKASALHCRVVLMCAVTECRFMVRAKTTVAGLPHRESTAFVIKFTARSSYIVVASRSFSSNWRCAIWQKYQIVIFLQYTICVTVCRSAKKELHSKILGNQEHHHSWLKEKCTRWYQEVRSLGLLSGTGFFVPRLEIRFIVTFNDIWETPLSRATYRSGGLME